MNINEHILRNAFFSMAVVGLIAFISFSFGVKRHETEIEIWLSGGEHSWPHLLMHSSSTQFTMALYANFYHTVYMQIVPSVL